MQIANVVRGTVRSEDVFARYGGEEFALVLRGIDIEGCGAVADRLRERIAALQIQTDRGTLKVTVSAGCASLTTTAEKTPEGLISAADRRLYGAKHAGRNRVVTTTVGRFGWKAEQPTVRQQSAGAFLGDMGLTTELFTEQDCTEAEAECAAATSGGAPEVSPELLERVAVYGKLVAVPVRVGADKLDVLRGRELFTKSGCASCHVPRHLTSELDGFPELSGEVIFPYTDLLLHDMGEGLSDGRPSFGAEGSEWRTPPLWGLGRYPVVNDHDRLLHDGRARGVAEAILWHGGEAEEAKERFRTLPAAERAQLVQFVESL